jgi:predicted anti-sigma-YlaC factor YlaD
MMLRRHLGQCELCVEFIEDTARVTQLLREAPLAELGLEIVVTRRRYRRTVFRAASGLAAACVVVAVAGITVARDVGYQAPPTQSQSPIGERVFTQQPVVGPETVNLRDPGPGPLVADDAQTGF